MSDVQDRTHPYGEAIRILDFSARENDEDINLEFDEDALAKILLHDMVVERKLVVVSIIGAFRKGKSFILDYFLRYMYSHYPSVATANQNLFRDKHEWMGTPNDPLCGFSWRSGISRVTSGILMWSDIFLHDKEDGERLAIVLMDTQGLFDREVTTRENVAIFSLSTLLSSAQIFNLSQNIQEDNLEYLQFATEYACFVTQNSKSGNFKPFQSLQFLIRDWTCPDDFPYGSAGGGSFLSNVLEVRHGQIVELKTVRESIKKSYEKLECYLMPYPGSTVATSKNYNGCLSEIEPDFVHHLKHLVPGILCPRKLQMKKVNNLPVKAFECFEYFKLYVKMFKETRTLPNPKSIYASTVEKHYQIIVGQCVHVYMTKLTDAKTGLTTIKNFEDLDQFHKEIKDRAQFTYDMHPKMGDAESEVRHKDCLNGELDHIFRGIAKIVEPILRNREAIDREKIIEYLSVAVNIGVVVASIAVPALSFLRR